MIPGNLWGNILLLTMATTGMSFTMSPYEAKKNSGLVLFIFFLILAAGLSSLSNMLLY
mgnify:CR=1 FL=1